MSIEADAPTLIDKFAEFLSSYYKDEIKRLAGEYPSERSLYVELNDLYQYEQDLAEDYIEHPKELTRYIEEALNEVDIPVDIDFGGAHVRVTGSEEYLPRLGVGQLRSIHRGQYIAVEARLANLAETEPRMVEGVFECQRCYHTVTIPQTRTKVQEPYKCGGCDRKTGFKPDFDASTFVDQLAMKLKEPPGTTRGGSGQELVAYAEDDLILRGGENGLYDRAGERVVVYGILTYQEEDLDGRNARPVPGRHLQAHAIEFQETALDDVDVDEHRAKIHELASHEQVHELLAASIAPDLYADAALETFLEAAVLYLFGGYRKERDGTKYRGDIHVLAIGDPSTGKTSIATNVAEISPRSEYVSGTQVTGVGLTASAVKGEFGGEQYSLKPGVLPLANGGHAVVDEIDKTGKEATDKLHEALGKDQRIRVSKGGIKASLNTRAGLLAVGNPKEGRFDDYAPIAEQVDLHPALLSRFDLIFVIKDKLDEDLDRKKAERLLTAWREASKATRGDEVTENETAPPVDWETFRAYVAMAREEINPVLPDGQVEDRLREFYVDRRTDADDDEPIPITARSLEAGLRLAEASARVRLSDEISMEDVERAIDLTKRVLSDVYEDPETGKLDADIVEIGQSKHQRDRVKSIRSLIEELAAEYDDGAPHDEVVEKATDAGMEQSKVEHEIKNLRERGDIYQPKINHYRVT